MRRTIALAALFLSIGCSRPDLDVEPKTPADATPRSAEDRASIAQANETDARSKRLATYAEDVRGLDERADLLAADLPQSEIDRIARLRDDVSDAQRRALVADDASLPFVETDLKRTIAALRAEIDRVSVNRLRD